MSGYVDLQVNGYAGCDFNGDDLETESVVEACRRMRADGVASALATIITASIDAMQRRIGRIAELIDTVPEVSQQLAGIHVEGPFINPAEGFVGAHPREHAGSADVTAMAKLLAAGSGHVRLVTLAPEMDDRAKLTRWLTNQNIVVAAGHSDASLAQLQQSLDAGLKLFTHLGNGCPSVLPRHDNIIQRVLSLSDRLVISFIADGHHIPPMALGNYLRCAPADNVVIVTDAISAAGLGPGKYRLGGQWVEVDPNGAAWSANRSHFAGSAATMPVMKSVLSRNVGVASAMIDRWMCDNPRRLLEQAQP